jgi:hypothetical protein
MLANLIFMSEAEIETKYDAVEQIGGKLVVEIFISDFCPGGAYLWGKASPLYNSQGEIVGSYRNNLRHH